MVRRNIRLGVGGWWRWWRWWELRLEGVEGGGECGVINMAARNGYNGRRGAPEYATSRNTPAIARCLRVRSR